MKGQKKTKVVKTIKIDVDKCHGCRACEVICSAFHAAPKYSSNNPGRSRIRVIHDPLADIYVPVYAGDYVSAECAGRDKYTIDGKEYDECSFCRASCPSRDIFKEPDSGLPLKCDMCESDPPLDEPMCVKWCIVDALTFEEREVEVEEDEEGVREEIEIGLEALANKYGLDKIADTVAPDVEEGLSHAGERGKNVETVAPFKEAIEEIQEAGAESCRLCYQCGKCDVCCPWNLVRDFSIRKVIREATFGLSEIEGEDVWRCTTCGSCPANCPRGVGQIEISMALRRVASEYGVVPASARGAAAAKGSIATEGNPLNEKRETRADWAKELSVKPFAEGMELLYFVGCYYAYDPRLKKVAVATANILNKAGVDFGILGTKESCCGESIRKAGGEDVFKAVAKENIKTFIDHGVKKIVVSSPHCYHTFAKEYPEFMVSFEIVHISELLAQLIDEGRIEIKGEYGKRVTYHDPCYLGRHSGIYDEPRRVLESIPGLELVEMSHAREGSLCCGGGGGRIWMDTPKGERFSDLRMEQADAVGAEVLATSCPYCITNFEESRLSREDEDGLEVRDIVEIVAAVI